MFAIECRSGRAMGGSYREPGISEILSDSLVKAVMRADGVDPKMLERDLMSMAQTMRANGWIEADRLTHRSSPRKRGPRDTGDRVDGPGFPLARE